jgi:hypothetical protein
VKRLLLGTPKPLRICGVKATSSPPPPQQHVADRRVREAPARRDEAARRHPQPRLPRARYWAVDRYPPIGERLHNDPGPLDDDPPPREPLQHRRRARNESAPLPYGSSL